MTNRLKQSLLNNNKENIDKKYIKCANFRFDYEKEDFLEDGRFSFDKFPDELVEKFYKCKKTNILNRNWIKYIINSKHNITRLTNDHYDLNLT